ncbi:PAS-domain containing protein [Halovulum sp. GXIMD14793]
MTEIFSLPTVLAAMALVIAIIGAYLAYTKTPAQPRLDARDPLGQLIFDGDFLRESTGPFGAKLPRGAALDEVLTLFNPQEEHLCHSLQLLIETGTRFDEVAQAADGDLVHVTGQPDGILAEVTVHASSPISEALYDIQSQLEVLMQERDRLRRRLASVPLAMMELDSKGREVWANRRFRALCDQVRAPQELVTLMKSPASEPVEVDLPGGETHWLRIVHRTSGDTTLVTAYPADEQMRAENNLSRFMTSLTDTFAHLKVGLTVFDSERRLSLFNPAISDMFKLDPAALIARPSLREFLEALRQTRMLPEVRDFAQWRARLTELDDSLEGGVFQEDWSLPSGQVLRITGRPHPDGALAFLFEDITSALTLERRYRQEIELGQGALDALGDAVAVIDTSGTMILANAAFEQMWQVEESSGLDALTLNQLLSTFRKQARCDDVWIRLQRFVQSATNREESWTAKITLKNGAKRYGRFQLLSGGAAMLMFHDHENRAAEQPQGASTQVASTSSPMRSVS